MAGSQLFGGYKIGGISDALSNNNSTRRKQDNAELLTNLFAKQSGYGIKPKKEKHESNKVTASSSSLTPRKIEDEEETRKVGNREIMVGVKRKESQGSVTVEPSRKKQRENRKKDKVTSENKDSDSPDRLARTVFVGNIPLNATRKEIKVFFTTYGRVESVRLRSVPVTKQGHSKKLAIVKREFHSDRTSMNAYVVFKERDNMEKALEARGSLFKGMHLRVDMAVKKEVDNNLSVFVGNLPFNIQEEELREHFSQCGDVDDVRIVRDKKTGVGKGFGYVAFKKKECVGFAIKLQNSELNGRKIRVFKSVGKNEGRKPFNKKKDRKYRLKSVTSRRDDAMKGQKQAFPPSKKRNVRGATKSIQKKAVKNINKGSKRFKLNKGKGKFKKKK